jgi:hypothetical protein
MLELLIAFGVGAATSSWMHVKSRKRSQRKAHPPVTLSPQTSAPRGPLTGSARVAVIFMALRPEISAKVFNELGPDDVQRITVEITQLPAIAPSLRDQILSEFCASLGIAPDRLEEAASEEPALIAKALNLLSQLPPAISA